jgi:hypothetical protein
LQKSSADVLLISAETTKVVARLAYDLRYGASGKRLRQDFHDAWNAQCAQGMGGRTHTGARMAARRLAQAGAELVFGCYFQKTQAESAMRRSGMAPALETKFLPFRVGRE